MDELEQAGNGLELLPTRGIDVVLDRLVGGAPCRHDRDGAATLLRMFGQPDHVADSRPQ